MNDFAAAPDALAAEAASAPHAIILAAGAASRFGSPKQAATLQGEPLLLRAVARAAAVTGNAVSVVLGAHAADLTPMLRHTAATVVINRDWREGIASSIRSGVMQLPGSCGVALLLLADQAAVTSADLERLLAAWRRAPGDIAAAYYSGLPGVPAIFPRAQFGSLLALRGDQGARALLKARVSGITRVPMPSAAIDVDTPTDLAQLAAFASPDPALSASPVQQISAPAARLDLRLEDDPPGS